MKYLSVCSGIEAASAAWHSLGWRPVAFSEIEPFPCSVLAERFPEVPNVGDMTRFEEWDIEPGAIDLLVGGTPCQSFSIAGLRGGLEDGRGNLALTYCRILQHFKPKWFVWENVPGVLSSNGGRDFGSILGAMAELGYGFAYRILDAQFFGVPQRRRRVFVVGCAGDWRRAAQVLFEPGCVSGDSKAGGKSRKKVARTIASRASGNGGLGADFDLAHELQVADVRNGTVSKTCQTLQSHHSGSSLNTMPVLIASTGNRSHCLNAGGMGRQDYETETMIVYRIHSQNSHAMREGGLADLAAETTVARCLDQNGGLSSNQGGNVVGVKAIGVRRLTPRECERLQGFPDDWTMVPYRGKEAADGPRYKAIGNSMAVPVMRWIGQRIEEQK